MRRHPFPPATIAPAPWCGVLASALVLGACQPSADRKASAPPVREATTMTDVECGDDSVRPASGAPAEGLWVYEDHAILHRVAAMVGPTQVSIGGSHLTRRVETVETRPGTDTIRYASDTASVRLEFVPPSARPAAVYPVGPLVMLASYEPCDIGIREPLIRYLRQAHGGRVATDVMLRREANP